MPAKNFGRACRLLMALLTMASLQGCRAADRPLSSSAGTIVDVADMNPGAAKEITVAGKPVILVAGTSTDAENSRLLTSFVFEAVAAEPLRIPSGAAIFAVIPISPYSLCRVEYVPRGKNKMQWDEESWLGGFHSPCHSEVFDLLGRQIRPGQYSPTSFPKAIGNLARPRLHARSETQVEVFVD